MLMIIIFFEFPSITWKNDAVRIWFRLRYLIWKPEVQAEWRCPKWMWENPQRFCEARTSNKNLKHFSKVHIISYLNVIWIRWTEAADWKVRPHQEYECPLNKTGGSITWMVIVFLLLVLYWCFPDYEVCYWRTFIFYCHWHLMCSWYINCLCTLYHSASSYKNACIFKYKYLLFVIRQNNKTIVTYK
jgi:hypothetical protein